MLHVPRISWFLIDGLNIIVFIHTFFRARKSVFVPIATAASALILVGLLGFCFNGSSLFCLAWGYRITLRFFVFLFNCSVLFDREDVEQILSVLHNMLFLNLALCMYQFLVLGLHGDFMGDMFGIEQGCNGYLTAYLCIVLHYSVSRYIYKKLSLFRFLVDLGIIMILSAFSELKIVLLLVPILLVMALILSDFNVRTFVIILMGGVFLVLAIQGLALIFPSSGETMKNVSNLMKYMEESYAGGLFYSRSNGFSLTNTYFFKGSILKTLFGYGLGQCDRSSLTIFSSSFFSQYGSMNYYFFFYAIMFLETGVLGLMIYIAFFLYGAVKVFFMKGHDISWIKLMCVFNAVVVVVMMFYNDSLRSDAGYIWMFAIAIPFIIGKEKYREETNTGLFR